jgi:hypothetical protein
MSLVTFDTVREIALSLPGVEEGTSYGTAAFRVRGKFLARLREDGETLVVKIGMEERDLLMQVDPEVFFTTDHYRGYPSVLIRLPAITRGALEDVLEQAWAAIAPAKLVKARKGGP